ncbi:hypothetical protein [Streptomyces sp. NPDC045470]|uniref:hypothetical protein n=1 Tax=Streptomyces sp. NPDC045470 TaxID=3155469 RepID=UPI00340C041B
MNAGSGGFGQPVICQVPHPYHHRLRAGGETVCAGGSGPARASSPAEGGGLPQATIAGEDLVPGRGEQHAGQLLFFVVSAAHRRLAVVEVQAVHGVGQARGEFIADGAHPQARSAVRGAGGLDADERCFVHGRGRGVGEAQPLVDACSDGASLGADAGRRHEDVVGPVLGAEALAQRLGTGRQLAVQEPAQWCTWSCLETDARQAD